MAGCGPQLQLRIAGCPHLQEVVVATIVQLQRSNGLRVAAVEAFGESKNRGKHPHDPPASPADRAVTVVASFRRSLSMIPGHERNCLNLVGLEASQISVLHKIV